METPLPPPPAYLSRPSYERVGSSVRNSESTEYWFLGQDDLITYSDSIGLIHMNSRDISCCTRSIGSEASMLATDWWMQT